MYMCPSMFWHVSWLLHVVKKIADAALNSDNPSSAVNFVLRYVNLIAYYNYNHNGNY